MRHKNHNNLTKHPPPHKIVRIVLIRENGETFVSKHIRVHAHPLLQSLWYECISLIKIFYSQIDWMPFDRKGNRIKSRCVSLVKDMNGYLLLCMYLANIEAVMSEVN